MRTVLIAVCLVSLLAHPAFAQEAKSSPEETKKDDPAPLSTEDTRLTTGIELLSPASSTAQQHFLMDFMVTAPLGAKVTRTTKPKFGAWFNARFNGSNANSVSSVKQFVGGFQDELVSGDIGTLLNSLTFRGGLEFKVGANGFDFGGGFQFQPVVIAAFGVQTVPALEKAAVFDLPPHVDDEKNEVANLPYTRWDIPTDKGYKYVALSGPDRRQFYGAYEFGVRFKSHHFKCAEARDECNQRLNFPGIIDLTVGQDEAITGGEFRGVVGKIDAFYPLPTDNLSNAIYFFGSARIHRNVKMSDGSELPDEEAPVILHAPDAVVALPSPEVFVHVLTRDERTRDEWKFGVGVDLMRLISASATARENDAAAKEDGSATTLADNSDVQVISRVIQSGETRTFNHGTDVVIAQQTVSLEGSPVTGSGSYPVSFTKDKPDVISATQRKLKNGTATDLKMIIVRLKPGEAKGEYPKDEKKSESKPEVHSRFRTSTVDCTMACDYVFKKDEVDNTVVLIPLTDAKFTADGAKDKKAYEAIVVDRKKDIDLSMSKAKFIVIRIR